MSKNSVEGQDLYLKVTKKDQSSYISQHRVWNAGQFLQSQMAEHHKQGSIVQMSTRDEYLQARQASRA